MICSDMYISLSDKYGALSNNYLTESDVLLINRTMNLRTCFKSVAGGSSGRRPERRNPSVLDVHEDFEHRATQQSGRVATFKTRSERCQISSDIQR